MNRNIFCFWMCAMFCAAMPLCAQEKSQGTEKSDTRTGRIEHVKEQNRDVIRFWDKDGKIIRDIDVSSEENTEHVSKEKAFNQAASKVKVSSKVAERIESLRKESGRNIAILQRTNREIFIGKNSKQVAIAESVYDFVDFADANDGERTEDAAEILNTLIVYDSTGKEIFRRENQPGGVEMSNTGEYFVVAKVPKGVDIINRNNEVLGAVLAEPERVYFSPKDRYVLVLHFTGNTDSIAITVFDTKERKLEFARVYAPWGMFASNEIPVINENKRTISVQHAWEPATKTAKVDTVRF
ncbi:MAG: YncE family protein [Elusimicrobiales bacterium]